MVLWFVSGVNSAGESFVLVKADGKVLGQLSPGECREHALRAMEAAEAAETDAFLWKFFREKIRAEPKQLAAVLMSFRQWREGRGGMRAPRREDFKEEKEEVEEGEKAEETGQE